MFQPISSIIFVTFCLAACAGVAPAPDIMTGAIPPLSQEGNPRTDGWQPSERLVKRRDRGSLAAIEAYRHGTAPGGAFYRVQWDGSGTLRTGVDLLSPTWTFDCTKDAITDRRDCRLFAPERLVFIFNGREPLWVCIGGHTYPRKKGAIRIDGGKPVETDERGCVGGAVAARLARSKEVVVRYVTWPYEAPQDAHPSMQGLADGLALVAYVNSNIDRLAFE